jgi:hypothetical protein
MLVRLVEFSVFNKIVRPVNETDVITILRGFLEKHGYRPRPIASVGESGGLLYMFSMESRENVYLDVIFWENRNYFNILFRCKNLGFVVRGKIQDVNILSVDEWFLFVSNIVNPVFVSERDTLDVKDIFTRFLVLLGYDVVLEPDTVRHELGIFPYKCTLNGGIIDLYKKFGSMDCSDYNHLYDRKILDDLYFNIIYDFLSKEFLINLLITKKRSHGRLHIIHVGVGLNEIEIYNLCKTSVMRHLNEYYREKNRKSGGKAGRVSRGTGGRRM